MEENFLLGLIYLSSLDSLFFFPSAPQAGTYLWALRSIALEVFSLALALQFFKENPLHHCFRES